MPDRLLAVDDGVAAWAALLRTHAAVVPKLAQALTEVDLPLSWYDVLLVLNAAPERRLRMSDLGAQAVLSREQISRVVTELVRAGYVERQANPDDKRSSYAVLTTAGRDRLRKAAPSYLGAVEEHFLAHLTDEEIAVLSGLLWRVVRAEEPSA